MSGDLTILYRSTDQTPLGQIADAAYIHNTMGIPPHRILGSYALIFLTNGEGVYADANHQPTVVSAGDLFILFPDVAHWYGPSRGRTWDEFYILFHGPVFDLWREVGLLTPDRPIFHLNTIEPWLTRLTNVVDVASDNSNASRMVMVGRLQLLLTDILTSQPALLESSSHLWLTEACHWLEGELGHDFEIQWLAAKIGLSYDAFRKKFTKATGMTPQQYRSAKRLQAAQKMLLETELTLKEIAASVGYYDEFAFSNRFKSIVGLSPRAFRRQSNSLES